MTGGWSIAGAVFLIFTIFLRLISAIEEKLDAREQERSRR